MKKIVGAIIVCFFLSLEAMEIEEKSNTVSVDNNVQHLITHSPVFNDILSSKDEKQHIINAIPLLRREVFNDGWASNGIAFDEKDEDNLFVVRDCHDFKGQLLSHNLESDQSNCIFESSYLHHHSINPVNIALNPDRSMVFKVSPMYSERTAKLITVSTNSEQRLLTKPLGRYIRTCAGAFSPDGYLITLATEEGVDICTLKDLHHLTHLKHPRGVYSVAFSPNGELVASGCIDRKIRIFDVQSACFLEEFKFDGGCIDAIAFSHDSSTLATGGSGGKVCFFNRTDKAKNISWKESNNRISDIAFSNKGKYAALIHEGKEVYTYELPLINELLNYLNNTPKKLSEHFLLKRLASAIKKRNENSVVKFLKKPFVKENSDNSLNFHVCDDCPMDITNPPQDRVDREKWERRLTRYIRSDNQEQSYWWRFTQWPSALKCIAREYTQLKKVTE